MAPHLKPVAFLLGVPRSGTTLLRVMLAGHPRLFAPPEMLLAPFGTMAERETHVEQRYWEKGGLRRALMELDGIDVDAAKRAVASLGDKTVPEVYGLLQERLGERMLNLPPRGSGEVRHRCPDLSRLNAMGPGPRWPLDEGLRDLIGQYSRRVPAAERATP